MNVLRDLSLILLAGEVFILGLIPLALFGGLGYGLWRLLQVENLPSWLRVAQEYLALGCAYVESAMRAVVEPILLVNSIVAMVRGWLHAIVKQGGSG